MGAELSHPVITPDRTIQTPSQFSFSWTEAHRPRLPFCLELTVKHCRPGNSGLDACGVKDEFRLFLACRFCPSTYVSVWKILCSFTENT